MNEGYPQRRKLDHMGASPLVQIGTAICSLLGLLVTGVFMPVYLSGQNRAEERQKATDQRLQRIEDGLNQGQVNGAAIVIRTDRNEASIAAHTAQLAQQQADITALKVKVDILTVRGRP